jgi:cytidylate kinase
MMAVVTISRQIGSLGYEIGKLVAEQMNYRILWRELINQAALKAGVPTVALAMIDELHLLGLAPSQQETQAYIEAVDHVIREYADQGSAVIVGRAGQVILAGQPNTIHVRIIAPEETRAQRLADEQHIPLQSALEQVKASDRYRMNYLRRFHHVDWDDPLLYHLVINTAHLTTAAAAAWICTLIQVNENQEVKQRKEGDPV